MLVDFFMHLKQHKLPVTTTEYLALLEALKVGLVKYSLDDFYTISRLCLIKNEAHYNKFNVAFHEYFENLHNAGDDRGEAILDDLLNLTPAQMQAGEAPLELDIPQPEMPRALVQRKKDDDDTDAAAQAGGGNNRRGEGGINEEGERIGKQHPGSRSAVKAWDSTEFKELDDEVELNTRSIKIALRRLRKFAREGTPDELDLDDTISSTARNAGWLDVRMRPERRNKVKVIILFDVRGSMDPYVKLCEELFSAAKAEFKQLEWYYFHNIVGESVWRNDSTHLATHYPLPYLMNRHGKDHKLIIVGDAAMGVSELTLPSVSNQHNHSSESGMVWLGRLLDHYKQAVWLNPEPQRFWHLTQTIGMLRDIMDQRMFPLTLSGLEQAMKVLGR